METKDPRPKDKHLRHRAGSSQANERKDALLRACLAKAKEQRQKNVSRRRSSGAGAGAGEQPTNNSALLLASLHAHNNASAEEQHRPPIEEGWSEEDEIMALLGGDRDLYLSLMTDLEEALLQDQLADEQEVAQERQRWELECWEEQLYAEAECDGEMFEQYQQQLRKALEPAPGPAAGSGSDEEQEQEQLNCSMQVLVNENSCDSADNFWGGKEGGLGLGMGMGMGLGEGEEETSSQEGPDGADVDYLVCPVCKRQCMELLRRSLLAECRCGASLYIGRQRHLAAQAAAGRHAAAAGAEAGRGACLGVEEIKGIIAEAMEAHRLACPVLQGAPLTIDFAEFRLQQQGAAGGSTADHPYLFLHCSHCGGCAHVL